MSPMMLSGGQVSLVFCPVSRLTMKMPNGLPAASASSMTKCRPSGDQSRCRFSIPYRPGKTLATTRSRRGSKVATTMEPSLPLKRRYARRRPSGDQAGLLWRASSMLIRRGEFSPAAWIQMPAVSASSCSQTKATVAPSAVTAGWNCLPAKRVTGMRCSSPRDDGAPGRSNSTAPTPRSTIRPPSAPRTRIGRRAGAGACASPEDSSATLPASCKSVMGPRMR